MIKYYLTENQYHQWKKIARQYCEDVNIDNILVSETMIYFFKHKFNVKYIPYCIDCIPNNYIELNDDKQLTMILLSLD